MTWHETHLRLAALREVEAAADRDPSGALPWRQEYAALFGDRNGLLTMLHYRWDLMVETQLDPELPDSVVAQTRTALETAHPGLRRILARHPRPADDRPEPQPQPLAQVS